MTNKYTGKNRVLNHVVKSGALASLAPAIPNAIPASLSTSTISPLKVAVLSGLKVIMFSSNNHSSSVRIGVVCALVNFVNPYA